MVISHNFFYFVYLFLFTFIGRSNFALNMYETITNTVFLFNVSPSLISHVKITVEMIQANILNFFVFIESVDGFEVLVPLLRIHRIINNCLYSCRKN